MSRSRQLAAAALDRRTLLATAGAASAATGLGYLLGPGSGSATARAPIARSLAGNHPHAAGAPAGVPSTTGTTISGVSAAGGGTGYRRLGDGPGWDRVVRAELGTPSGGREEKRTALASFVQFTDLHLVDVQHPLRFEYLRAQTASAWRPQETLSVQGTIALIERVNGLRGGPVTGAPVSFVVTTGDNTDNNCRAELDWYLTVMSGGRIVPNTGDPRRYEGVQSSGLPLYWQPDDPVRDNDKRLGFPHLDGFLAAAIRQVTSPGLAVPWYSTVGNHDSLPGGAFAAGDGFFADIAVGDRKLMDLPGEKAAALRKLVEQGNDPKGEAFKEMLRANARRARPVTPDPARAPFTPAEYVRAHLDPRYAGAGPVGHGYTDANLAEGSLYYTFPVSDNVIGISLDTVRADGDYRGAVGRTQLRWLARQLKQHRDAYVLVFSHHTSTSIREGREELLTLLKGNPQVVAWINGHHHTNKIRPFGTFWEISTASHIDFPQLARIIELADNRDGTISLFTTLIESAAPARTDFADLSQTGLAALYRELAFNSPGARTTLAGAAGDRNTELVLRKP
ncbi:TIGR03767 family metallophosphoesterase [Streptomyces gobiensis]|uniref:TIGR03767 family metallophosphoesterase n=1 Tax=Streptomyces gobiensis TaxID=2875706 RepID=UPI001E65059F|nr:TIGR03767 family metallophosphoesterase [Streptomyces gobiensis]UGY91442.1 TIGR03767 family metallophosphoesterase [Streptomyces gobiensis]